jgi:spore coat polysaccharide biosynthesis protein SpsF
MLKANPHILTVVQTRRGSSRLPDKVLLPVLGKHLFVQEVERILAAELSGTVVVATTTHADDDAIEKICFLEGFACFRGSETDLLDRHYQAALHHGADVIVKIPSDCPLIDPDVIDRVIQFYLNHQDVYDYVSNLHPATYPDGNDVEVMSFDALQKAWQEANKNFEREHTTPYIWERPQQFRIGNVAMEGGKDFSMSHRWTIDYPEDYAFVKMVFEALHAARPFFSYKDILLLLEQKPEIGAINQHLAGVNWYRHCIDELQTISPSQTKQYAAINE